MASVRDSLGSVWWKNMYDRYNYHDPSNQYYGKFPTSGLNQPMFIEANPHVAVQLSRHCNGVCAYDVGSVDRRFDRDMAGINQCSDLTGAPYVCVTSYAGGMSKLRGSPKYDRTG